MKKWILSIMAVIAIQIQAADVVYKYLVVTSADGTQTALGSDGLKLSFADGQMTAASSTDNKSFTLTSLASMQFAETASTTAIDSSMTADGLPMEAYTLSGMFVGTFHSMSALQSQLRSGVYVVKQNNKSSKIIVK